MAKVLSWSRGHACFVGYDVEVRCPEPGMSSSMLVLSSSTAQKTASYAFCASSFRNIGSRNTFYQVSSHLEGHRAEVIHWGQGAECVGVCKPSIESLVWVTLLPSVWKVKGALSECKALVSLECTFRSSVLNHCSFFPFGPRLPANGIFKHSLLLCSATPRPQAELAAVLWHHNLIPTDRN